MSGPVNKRASLPGASELFGGSKPKTGAAKKSAKETGKPAPVTGRQKHDQRITVYLSSDDLFALEGATLEVRRRLGASVDRGRLVRAAIAVALADLEAHGDDAAVLTALAEPE